MIFSVVKYRCKSWTIKKAECQRIDGFELWCWRRLLRVLDSKEINQSILKEINTEYSFEGLMLKLKHQYFGHLMWRVESLKTTLMLRRTKGKRRRGQQRIRWLDSITDLMNMNLIKLWKTLEDRGAWHTAVHGFTKGWTRFSNWKQ